MTNEIATVDRTVKPFIILAGELEKKAKDLKVETIEQSQEASLILKQCQDSEKQIEETRTAIVRPINNKIAEINNSFRIVSKPFADIKIIVKEKILTFNEIQEKKRKDEEARLAKIEAERLAKIKAEQDRLAKIELEKRLAEQRKLDADKKKMSDERAKLEQEKLDLAQKQRDLDAEKKRIADEKALAELTEKNKKDAEEKAKTEKIKGVTKRWTYEIIDENQIPRQFCSSDSKKINEAIKSGVRVIAGVKVYEATDIR